MERMGWDDQMRDLNKIHQVHVRAGDGWIGWDGMIKGGILKQKTKVTYLLETDEEDGMIRGEILKQKTNFTYLLETDEEDGMGWSEERC